MQVEHSKGTLKSPPMDDLTHQHPSHYTDSHFERTTLKEDLSLLRYTLSISLLEIVIFYLTKMFSLML